MIDILITIALALAVILIIRRLLLNKKQGKCSCGCADCPSKDVCHIKDDCNKL